MCLEKGVVFGKGGWKRGLKKGVGLCHGIGGNGLALYSLYRATSDEIVSICRYFQFENVKTEILVAETSSLFCRFWNWKLWFAQKQAGQSEFTFSRFIGLYAFSECFEKWKLVQNHSNFSILNSTNKITRLRRCRWQVGVGDRISILVTSFECWCPTPMLKDRACWWWKRPKP